MDCWSKGRGKEGQCLKGWKSKGKGKGKATERDNIASSEPDSAWVALAHDLFEPVVSNNYEDLDANNWLCKGNTISIPLFQLEILGMRQADRI